jgi:hypothetical protein
MKKKLKRDRLKRQYEPHRKKEPGLFAFDNNLEGATDSAVGADELAQRAPAAPIGGLYHDGVAIQYQGAGITDFNAETAPLTLFLVDYRYFFHVRLPNRYNFHA